MTAVTTAPLTCELVLSEDLKDGRTYTETLPGMDRFVCPSVTTILDCVQDSGKGLFIWWAECAVRAALVHGNPDRGLEEEIKTHKVAGFGKLNEASERGTAVHEAATRLLLGQPDGLSPVYDANAIPYLTALQAFLVDHRPEAVAVECPVFNRTYGFAGRFDAIVRMPSMPGKTVLLDWKSRAKRCDGARAKEAPQMAAYARGEYLIAGTGDDYRRVPMPKVDAAVVVQLAPDGTYLVSEVPIDDGVFACFLGALQAAPYLLLRDDKKGTPVPAATVGEALESSLAAADLPVPPPDDDPFTTFGAAPVKVDTVLVDWLRARARWLHQENPAAFDQLAAAWPDDTPGLYGQPLPGPEHIGVICHHFGQVEADFAVPFFDQADPRAVAACKVRPALGALPPAPARTSAPPPADGDVLAWILSRWGDLPADARADIETAAMLAGITDLRHGATDDDLAAVRYWVVEAEAQVSDRIAATIDASVAAQMTSRMVAKFSMKATDGRTGDVDLLTAAEHGALRTLISQSFPTEATPDDPYLREVAQLAEDDR